MLGHFGQPKAAFALSVFLPRLERLFLLENSLCSHVVLSEEVWNAWNQLDLVTTIPGWVTLILSSTLNIALLRTLVVRDSACLRMPSSKNLATK